jgi:hypothetical protein
MGKSTSTSSMAFLLKSFRLSKHLVQIRDAQNHIGEREGERERSSQRTEDAHTHGRRCCRRGTRSWTPQPWPLEMHQARGRRGGHLSCSSVAGLRCRRHCRRRGRALWARGGESRARGGDRNDVEAAVHGQIWQRSQTACTLAGELGGEAP